MTQERPVPEGWESRERLVPIGAPTFVRDAIILEACQRLADKIDGLDSESKDPVCQQAYEDFCFGYDRKAWRPIAADDLSACVIVTFAVLDCFGCEMPATDTGYEPRMGRAVTELTELGRDMNAWLRSVGREAAWHDMTIPGAELPRVPFVGLVGDNKSEGAEHGYIGLDGIDENNIGNVVEGGRLTTVPGKRGFSIGKGVYEYETRAPGQVWARRKSPLPNRWRRLRGWLDIGALPLTQRATLPA